MAVGHYLHTLHTFLLVLTTVQGQQGTAWTNTTTPSMKTPGRIPLHLIGLFPFTGLWPGAKGLLPAVYMALEDVNNRRDVLSGYELIMSEDDAGCSPGLGINALFTNIYSPPTKIAIVGPACSITSEPVAFAAVRWNLVQVGYSASSPALSNKDDFPYFLRLAAPESLMNPARIAIMKKFNWKRVATIHEPVPIYSQDIDDLRLRLTAENITLISSHIISENPALQIQSLLQNDARIIVISSYEPKMISVICEAYKAGMYGRRYVWIMGDYYSKDWPYNYHSDNDCTPEERLAVIMPSGIFITFLPILGNRRETRGLAGMSPPEYMKRYFKRTDDNRYTGIDESGLAYDSIWAIALGLNKTAADLQGSGKGLEDFTYSDKAMGDLILKNLWHQKFLGVNGEVFFDKNGDAPRDVQIAQYRGTQKHEVGIYVQSTKMMTFFDEIGIAWEDGVPKDATTFRTVRVFVSGTVYYSVCCCASIGMVVAAAFLVFNVYFRKLRIIKMSSPVMNNVILLGCIVVYLTVFLQELSADNVALLCRLRTVSIMVGFSLSFGALFAKTWRVYVIFTNTTKKVVLHDYQLLLIVGVLVLIDLTAFVLRETLDTPEVVNTVLEKEILNNGDLVMEREVLACQSDYSLYFEASVMVYKGLLLIFGAFLAFQTRKVNIPALNDSQYIGMCVYNVTILSILGVVLVFALQNQVVLSYTLVSAFIIFATTIVQLTIFIPKVLKVYNTTNQVKEADDSAQSEATSNIPKTAVTDVENNSDKVRELKRELETTKKLLQEAKEEPEELKQELDATKKQLQEAREEPEELKQELDTTKKQLQEAREGQRELKQELDATKKQLQEAKEGGKGATQ